LRTGVLGLSLPTFLSLRTAADAADRPRRAKSCMLLYCWGGMSHHETFDLKPDAPEEYRGEFNPIATRVPGIHFGEHIPGLAQQADKLAVIRSIHHRSSAHGKGMYWNFTGHPPLAPELAVNVPPTRADWPSLSAMIAKFRRAPVGFPAAVQIPHPMVDNDTRQAGEGAGFLGQNYDPVIVRPDRGQPWGGVSRDLGQLVLTPCSDMDDDRARRRERLLRVVDGPMRPSPSQRVHDQFHTMASDLLTSPRVRSAFDLNREPAHLRDRYGGHVCGQSLLLGRRLIEAGVPCVTVLCSAGDLNNGAGDHWDTHSNNFVRLRRDLLPPLDRGLSVLLADLADRGLLDETVVLLFTEFGRTPKVNRSAGRDHYPSVYSVALAGGGIRGGQVYGSSDRLGAFPFDRPCSPADLHATLFHALGIPLDSHLEDGAGRVYPLTDGDVLPLF
jgi:hypothetical protein